jgi:glycosyltransferase involved in cell wall biosynthesis
MIAPFGMRPKGTLLARMLPLSQALVRRGHAVTIVAPPLLNPEDAGTEQVLGGVLVRHTALPRAPGLAGVAEQAALLAGAALEAAPDVLHLFKPKGFGGLAALALSVLRPALPLALDSDDWEGWGGWNDLLPYPALAKMLFAWQERDLPGRARVVSVASRTLERQARGFGVPQERIFYIPNGTSKLQRVAGQLRPHGELRLLLYTRFWEFGLHEVVAALAGIAARCPTARLLIVGRGEHGEEHEFLRLAARAGLGGMCEYRGWVEPELLPALLASADIALAPMEDTLINRARGLAKLLELMQAGLPIVASRVGQAAEYLEHGRSGWLVPPGDAGAFAAGAIGLLEHADLRRRLAEGALSAADRFSWDALAPTAEQAYDLARGEF